MVVLVTPSAASRWVQVFQSISGRSDATPAAIEFPESPPVGLRMKFSSAGVHGETGGRRDRALGKRSAQFVAAQRTNDSQ